MPRARFELSNAAIAEASIRKARRWEQVIHGRAVQGRFTGEVTVYPDRPWMRVLSFEWTDDQHSWMRRFLGRFARAWLASDDSSGQDSPGTVGG
jgi:hypothetical protein